MFISRIYQAVSLSLHSTIHLDQKASHHLTSVLRATIDDKLTLFNGQGGEYEAVITHIDKKGVDVEIKNFSSREAESPIQIHLAQGIARGEKMDFIVQKSVELGVTKIFPLITERCNVRLDSEREEKRLQRWQSIIISACEQSGRNRVPEIAVPMTLKAWLSNVKADKCFVLSPHVQNKLLLDVSSSNASIALLIGPEGGLSDFEVETALQHGFLPLNLGPRVLRTETATISAITALQYRYGDIA